MSITAYPTATMRKKATVSGVNIVAMSLVTLLVLLCFVHSVHDLTLKSKDSLRGEIRELVDEKESINESKLKSLFVRIDQLEKSVEELKERVKKEKNERVDYALRSSGARVLKHSEVASKNLLDWFWLFNDPNWVSSDAKKMLTPSFDEPGHCLALKGTTGFVVIRLSRAIVPEAITLEHLAKGEQHQSKAPKDWEVSGWLGGEDLSWSVEPEKMVHLGEFRYDVEKSSAQTFKVSASAGVIDTVRVDVKSNYGESSQTCIYRLKVHGREPHSAPILQDIEQGRDRDAQDIQQDSHTIMPTLNRLEK